MTSIFSRDVVRHRYDIIIEQFYCQDFELKNMKLGVTKSRKIENDIYFVMWRHMTSYDVISENI